MAAPLARLRALDLTDALGHFCGRVLVDLGSVPVCRRLDEVERGGEVSVDRGKQTFRIVAGHAAATAKTRRKKLDFQRIDERLLDGWTWQWQGPGRPMKLRVGGPRRRRRA